MEKYFGWLKSHKFVGIILAVGVGVIAIGDFTDAISKIQNSIKLFLSSKIDNELVNIERMTVLETKGTSFAFDLILSNKNKSLIWVNEITLVGIGGNNNICNPNPTSTFHYNVSFNIEQQKINGKVTKNSENLSIPATGYFEHKYCEGFLIFTFPQTFKIPPNEKISYIFEVTEVNLDMINVTSKWLKPSDPIPRLGLSGEQVEILGKTGLWTKKEDFPPKKFFRGSGPSYYLPVWGTWKFIFHIDNGGVFSTKPTRWGIDLYKKKISDALIKMKLNKDKVDRIMSVLWKKPDLVAVED